MSERVTHVVRRMGGCTTPFPSHTKTRVVAGMLVCTLLLCRYGIPPVFPAWVSEPTALGRTCTGWMDTYSTNSGYGSHSNSLFFLFLSNKKIMSIGDSQWYASLKKSSLNPPPIVFQVVWPILYTLMAVSAWTWWSEHPASFTLLPYAIPILFNALWVWVFFVQRQLTLSVIVLVLNLAVSMWSLSRARVQCPPAARWLVPNVVWLLFALYLNVVVWWKNQ